MPKKVNASSFHAELVLAVEQQSPILANLLELYAHDFSELTGLAIGDDGRFGYARLPLYWSETDRYPLLLFIEGRPAGFALVKRGSEQSGREAVWDMAEFFVLRGHRGHGVGTEMAHRIWRRFPGAWEVRVLHAQGAAQRFWSQAIAAFTAETIPPVRFEKEGKQWDLFSFSTGEVHEPAEADVTRVSP